MRKKQCFMLIPLLLILVLAVGISCAVATEQDQAVGKAESYISFMAFSRSGLIKQLEFEGFSHEDAEYGADHCGADWAAMAEQKASDYMDFMSFSYSGLIKQLEYEGFSSEDASNAVDKLDIDWKSQAVAKAESYLEFMTFSQDSLVRQLEFEGFSHEDAVYGAISALAGDSESVIEFDSDPIIDETVSEPETETADLENTDSAAITEVGETYEEVPVDSSAEEIIPEVEQTPALKEQTVSLDAIKILLNNMDNLFPIRSMEESFTSPAVATYSDIGPATAIQTSNQDGERRILMFANSDSVHDNILPVKLNSGNLQNFYISMDVTVNDVYPSGTGGCYIGYINEPTGAVAEETVSYVALIANDKETGFYKKDKDADAGIFTSIQAEKGKSRNLTLIRLTGQTFAFVNNQYIGQYHDSENGPFQLQYGVAILSEGDTANCSFDNLVIRKVLN